MIVAGCRVVCTLKLAPLLVLVVVVVVVFEFLVSFRADGVALSWPLSDMSLVTRLHVCLWTVS